MGLVKMDEFMLESHYRQEDRDRDFLPDWVDENEDELIKDDEAISDSLNKDTEVYYPC